MQHRQRTARTMGSAKRLNGSLPRPEGQTKRRMSGSVKLAVTSCRLDSLLVAQGSSGCAAVGKNWRPSRPRCKPLMRRSCSGAQNGRPSTLAKLGGRRPAPPDPQAFPKRGINTTDPDSRVIPRSGKAAIQGYDAQPVACAGQIVLVTEITQQTNDYGQLGPMIAATTESLARAGVTDQLQVVLAYAGYWSSPQIATLGEKGIQTIVPTKAITRSTPRARPAREGPEARRIEALLDTPEGAALHRRRQQIIESVFANTKFLRRIDRFQRRGLQACRAEWRLIAATHNLLKLWRATRPAIPA